MGKFVDNIPLQFQPHEEEHVIHVGAIRALKDNRCDIDSFLPTFIERNKHSFFSGSFSKSEYSMSLFTSLEALHLKFNFHAIFWKNHKGVAQGTTSIKRGISLKAGTDGHIDYFIYDTYNNNPCDDFKVIEDTFNE